VSLAQQVVNGEFVVTLLFASNDQTTRMTFAFTFPGQGSQTLGMGRSLAQDYAIAREVFQEVDEALQEPLSRIMWEGPEETLTLTKNAQPALMAVSLAAFEVLRDEFGEEAIKPRFVAGHSLGEYSALAASGVFSVADAARLLRLRGLAMQEAVPAGQGAMLALLGVEVDTAEKLARAASDNDACQVANDNAPGQVVISGSKAAIDRAMKLAPELGIRRAVPLTVSAPFHCALMKPAAERMAEALDAVMMHTPRFPVVSNVTAKPVLETHEIKTLLVQQVTGVVRWRESVAYMVDHGADTLFEIGAGRVLTGLAKRIRGQADSRSVGTPDDVVAFGNWLKARMAA
jgi:[acyl-carrier-protein] S-malonyltransferase